MVKEIELFGVWLRILCFIKVLCGDWVNFSLVEEIELLEVSCRDLVCWKLVEKIEIVEVLLWRFTYLKFDYGYWDSWSLVEANGS